MCESFRIKKNIALTIKKKKTNAQIVLFQQLSMPTAKNKKQK